MPWLHRVALRLSLRVPEPLLAQPERVFINVAAIVLGFAALWPPPDSIASVWPDWFRLEWAAAMILGGMAALHGTWTGYRLTERLGAALFACGAAVWAVQAWLLFGLAALGPVLIFAFLAAAKTLRVLRSLATSAVIAESLRDRGTGGAADGRHG